MDRIQEQGLLPQGFPQTKHVSLPEAFTSSWAQYLVALYLLGSQVPWAVSSLSQEMSVEVNSDMSLCTPSRGWAGFRH